MANVVLARPEREAGTTFHVREPFFEAHPILVFEFPSGGVDVRVPHDLGRLPAGYLVVGRSANANVYDGIDASTESELVLRSSATATVYVVAL